MRFPADMGVSQSVVTWLRAGGHDAVRLLDRGLEKSADADVFALAVLENRILLTFDLDFGEIMALGGGPATGVILFRLKGARAHRVQERLAVCLAEASAALQENVVVVVEESRLRIRHWP
jgi:predicted nuclease of predicted toxin-antitoxin system